MGFEQRAKAKVLKQTESTRYGEDGYFLAKSDDTVKLAHPTSSTIGKNAGDLRQTDGELIWREFVSLGQRSGWGL
ncbi:cache domain-containing protein [Caballeronia grimmiae]|uniref:cache domain-containing protein n=1 Tax=Caballeronia grimmiae TaxID=1071679 RepID=UPI0009E0803F